MVFASVGKKKKSTTTSSVLPHSPVSAVSVDAAASMCPVQDLKLSKKRPAVPL